MERMLTPQELARLCVVLVRARNPNNIGAAARAMHDFGFTRLRAVNEFPVPFEAARSAVDASAVMAEAVSFPTLAEAVADCTLVIGTTAVGERTLQHQLLPLAQAAPTLRAELQRDNGRIALLFGSEKTGLSNAELSHCNWLLTIPMHEHSGVRHPSMNLGQAVAVCLYELVRDPALPATNSDTHAISDGRPPSPESTALTPNLATAAELERLTTLLHQVLETTGYTRHHPANSDPEHLRRLVRRMAAEQQDAPVWMGILRQTLWKLHNSPQQDESV
jgi:TrmH family RNA methyltransferase